MTMTILVLNVLWVWNDFQMPLIILNQDSSTWTLPLFQYNFKSQYTYRLQHGVCLLPNRHGAGDDRLYLRSEIHRCRFDPGRGQELSSIVFMPLFNYMP